MLNADLHLRNETTKAKGGANNVKEDESAAGFHFIAFVPIDDHIWKLDGLERQPQKLCRIVDEDWVIQTKPEIESRMAEYADDQIEFSILSLVKEPLRGLISTLARNVKTVSALATQMQVRTNGTMDMADSCLESVGGGSFTQKADPIYRLTQDMIDRADITSAAADAIQRGEAPEMMQLWTELMDEQLELKASIREEQTSDDLDQERADSRRFDYGPSLHSIIQILARKKFFKASNIQ